MEDLCSPHISCPLNFSFMPLTLLTLIETNFPLLLCYTYENICSPVIIKLSCQLFYRETLCTVCLNLAAVNALEYSDYSNNTVLYSGCSF